MYQFNGVFFPHFLTLFPRNLSLSADKVGFYSQFFLVYHFRLMLYFWSRAKIYPRIKIPGHFDAFIAQLKDNKQVRQVGLERSS